MCALTPPAPSEDLKSNGPHCSVEWRRIPQIKSKKDNADDNMLQTHFFVGLHHVYELMSVNRIMADKRSF